MQTRLFAQLPGHHCATCAWEIPCGAALTDDACPAEWGLDAYGGQNALHPADPDIGAYMASVGGPEYDTVHAQPVGVPPLGDYLPQIRMRRALRGQLDEPIYAVRARDVLRAGGVVSSGQLRDAVGLAPWQRLVVLLFDKDHLLEQLWSDGPTVLRSLAEGGYDLVVAPSYSTWTPRPRTDFLYNTKRSLVVFEALQILGVPAVPRLAWNSRHDAQRAARWLTENSAVTVLGLDLTTYRNTSDWRAQLDGLDHVDALTGRRLRYLINGPSRTSRYSEIFACVDAGRVTITNATMGPPARELGLAPTATFAQRSAVRRSEVLGATPQHHRAHPDVAA